MQNGPPDGSLGPECHYRLCPLLLQEEPARPPPASLPAPLTGSDRFKYLPSGPMTKSGKGRIGTQVRLHVQGSLFHPGPALWDFPVPQGPDWAQQGCLGWGQLRVGAGSGRTRLMQSLLFSLRQVWTASSRHIRLACPTSASMVPPISLPSSTMWPGLRPKPRSSRQPR